MCNRNQFCIFRTIDLIDRDLFQMIITIGTVLQLVHTRSIRPNVQMKRKWIDLIGQGHFNQSKRQKILDGRFNLAHPTWVVDFHSARRSLVSIVWFPRENRPQWKISSRRVALHAVHPSCSGLWRRFVSVDDVRVLCNWMVTKTRRCDRLSLKFFCIYSSEEDLSWRWHGTARVQIEISQCLITGDGQRTRRRDITRDWHGTKWT